MRKVYYIVKKELRATVNDGIEETGFTPIKVYYTRDGRLTLFANLIKKYYHEKKSEIV